MIQPTACAERIVIEIRDPEGNLKERTVHEIRDGMSGNGEIFKSEPSQEPVRRKT